MMVPSPHQIQILRHGARAALSRGRRKAVPPTLVSVSASASASASDGQTTTRGAAAPHCRRGLATSTIPLRAQPNKFVAGVTPRQLEESQAVRDWYAANFGPDWQDEPDVTTASALLEEEAGDAGAADEEEDKGKGKEEEEEYSSIIELPEELTRRNIRPLVAYLREPVREEGGTACKRMRTPKVNDPDFPLIPGILHGSDPTRGIVSVNASSKVMVKTPWFEIQRELDRYHWGITGSFVNRVYALTVFPSEEASLDHHRGRQPKDRTEYRLDSDTMTVIATPPPALPTPPPRTPVEGMENVLVIPADLQMHPVAHAPFCLNFVRYHPGKPIKLPIRNINEEESPAIKRGGFLCYVNRFLECTVEEGAVIPEFIGLDCTDLRAKDVVRRGEGRLMVPEGVTIHPRVPADFLMGTVYGMRGGIADEEGEEEGGEEKK